MKADAQQREMQRKRAVSAATAPNEEVGPGVGEGEECEVFQEEVEVDGVRFRAVRLFHPRMECLGTTWSAVAVSEGAGTDASVTTRIQVEMQLHAVSFAAQYYTTSQGASPSPSFPSAPLLPPCHPVLIRPLKAERNSPSSPPSSAASSL